MKSKSRSFIYIATGSLLLLFFLVYRYGFEERYLNFSTQTTVIDLSYKNNAYLIEKHPKQGNIAELELEIKGKLSDNITLHLSKDGVTAFTSIRLKKGKLNTSFLIKWQTDNAYVLVENPHHSKSKLEMNYQFVSE